MIIAYGPNVKYMLKLQPKHDFLFLSSIFFKKLSFFEGSVLTPHPFNFIDFPTSFHLQSYLVMLHKEFVDFSYFLTV